MHTLKKFPIGIIVALGLLGTGTSSLNNERREFIGILNALKQTAIPTDHDNLANAIVETAGRLEILPHPKAKTSKIVLEAIEHVAATIKHIEVQKVAGTDKENPEIAGTKTVDHGTDKIANANLPAAAGHKGHGNGAAGPHRTAP